MAKPAVMCEVLQAIRQRWEEYGIMVFRRRFDEPGFGSLSGPASGERPRALIDIYENAITANSEFPLCMPSMRPQAQTAGRISRPAGSFRGPYERCADA